jgi:hypothetical protein
LTINYIVTCGDWEGEQAKIEQTRNKLSKLYKSLFPSRDKILAHNDIKTILEGNPLGSFEDLDSEDFKVLQELTNAVSAKWLGQETYLFNSVVERDAKELVRVLAGAVRET